ncbi:MAG TPA: sialidase family protein [Oscillospiraceae bacterium]|nr:sialidase family protein [Oscillospiraceae bacterium]
MDILKLSSGDEIKVLSKKGEITFNYTSSNGEVYLPAVKGLWRAKGKNPMLYKDKDDTLWLFYTAYLCVDEVTAQIMSAYALKGEYTAQEINFRWHDALYPRLGGSFTNERQSAGVNEKEDKFSPELVRRYTLLAESLQGTCGFSWEQAESYINEKRSLALGKLYGVKIAENNYPFARRIGFSLKGHPIEVLHEGKTALVLPVYSEIFNCLILLYSFDKGENYDSKDYLICYLNSEDTIVLIKENGGIKAVKSSKGKDVEVGFTSDFQKSWQNLYSGTDFIFKTNSVFTPKVKKERFRTKRIKVFGKPSPKRFFSILNNVVKTEGVLEFTSKSKRPSIPAEFSPKQIKGLSGYETPVIEDVFPPIKEHAHGSGIACLPDGELISVWFQSDGERKGNDGRILAARKPVGSAWLEPFVIADVKGMADCNPTIYLGRDDRLWFFWYPVLSNAWETSQPKYRYADKGNYEYKNGFKTIPNFTGYGILNPSRCDELQGKAIGFEKGEYIYGEVNGECRYISEKQFRQNPLPELSYVKIEDRYITDPFVVALRNSTIDFIKYIREGRKYAALTPLFEVYLWWEARRICRYSSGADSEYKRWKPIKRALGWQTKNKPLEFEFEGKTRLLLPLYTDGIHCSLTAFTDDGGKTWSYSLPFVSIAPEQGADIMLSSGILRTYFRNSEPEKHIISYESSDGGKSYNNVKIEKELLHQGGFDIIKVEKDLWVMSVTSTHTAKGIRKNNRSLLKLAVSKDEGKSWLLSPLEFDANGLRYYHYSAITKNKYGDIFVSYSYDDENGLNSIRCASIKKKRA